MKKLFLLLAGAGMAFSAVAQEKSVIFVNNKMSTQKGLDQWGPTLKSLKYAKSPAASSSTTSAAKTSDWASGEWFCFADASAAAGTAEYAAWPVYPDSNIHTGNFNWYLHGFGTSFDPKSYKFTTNGFINFQPVYPVPTFPVNSTTSYKVDSFEIVGWYQRVDDNVVDTLDIYVGYATYPAGSTPGAYNISWSFTIGVDTFWGRPDSGLQAVQPVYDYMANGMNSDTIPNMIKITKILDASAFADSMVHPTSNGSFLHVWKFAMPGGGMTVPAGGNMWTFAAFRSAVQHPLGTDWNLANQWQHWTVAVNGAGGIPDQDTNDFNTGLGAYTPERYHIGNYWELSNTTIGQHNTLAPTYTYTPEFMSDPWWAFHIMDPVSVKEVNNNAITDVSAYPSPANTEVNVTFTSIAAGKANISIANAVGQVVETKVMNVKANELNKATFSTATLANGIYFYTVEANGQRQTNRFVVTH